MPSPSARRQPRRVLLYRLGSLGDTLIALPALHLIAQTYPEAERRLLTSFPPTAKAPASSAILQHTGLVHGYFRYNHGTRSARELLALWWQLVTWRPDVLVYLSGARGVSAARRDAAFFRACGIRHQVGVPVTDTMQRNLPAPERGPGMVESEAARLVRNIRPLGEAHLDDPAAWSLELTKAERGRAAELLGSAWRHLPSWPSASAPRCSPRTGAAKTGAISWPPQPPAFRISGSCSAALAKSPTPATLPRKAGAPTPARPSSTCVARSTPAKAPQPSNGPRSLSATTPAPCTSPPPCRPHL